MELQTEAVDRVLEALSPTLTAELERVVEETRQKLEAEFEKRLQTAIRDVEESTRMAGDAERHHAVEQAIEETRESVRSQVAAELQAEFDRRLAEFDRGLEEVRRRLEDATSRVTAQDAELQRAYSEWSRERERLQKQMDRWRAFAEAERRLIEAGSQPELLIRWLNIAEEFATSVAVYTAKPDGLALWKSRGIAVFPLVISQQTTDPESYFKPIVIRSKTLAAVSALPPFQADALDFLATTLEHAVELFGFRLRGK